MADSSSYAAMISFLLVMVALAMNTQPSMSACLVPYECEINLSYYLHQIGSGPNHNQETMVSSPYPQSFGAIVAQDWTIIDTPEPNAAIVGHARGLDVQADQAAGAWHASLTIVFENGRFKGSKFQVMGIIDAEGELAITGGTGQFATARGTINTSLIKVSSVENYRSIDIHAYVLQNGGAAPGKAIV